MLLLVISGHGSSALSHGYSLHLHSYQHAIIPTDIAATTITSVDAHAHMSMVAWARSRGRWDGCGVGVDPCMRCGGGRDCIAGAAGGGGFVMHVFTILVCVAHLLEPPRGCFCSYGELFHSGGGGGTCGGSIGGGSIGGRGVWVCGTRVCGIGGGSEGGGSNGNCGKGGGVTATTAVLFYVFHVVSVRVRIGISVGVGVSISVGFGLEAARDGVLGS